LGERSATTRPAGETAPRSAFPSGTGRASATVLVAALLFGLLAWLVSSGLSTEPDRAFSVGLQRAQSPPLTALMVLVSYPGYAPQSALIVLAAAGLFVLAGHRAAALFAVLAGAGIWLIGSGLKQLWLRPRPEDGLVQVFGGAGGYSFPSGHVLFYVSFFGFLLYWSFAHLRKGWLRSGLIWLCGLLIALVGPSRVYLGQHWTSDVLAAYAFGLAYLLGLIRLYNAARLHAPRPRGRAGSSSPGQAP
jgi:membrane-associated phospholipid phosphatase